MTLNDLECPIHLKVHLVDGTLDVRLLRVSDSTIRIHVARGREEGEWARGPSLPSCGQLTRCFFAVAELLIQYAPAHRERDTVSQCRRRLSACTIRAHGAHFEHKF